ncbi:MOSC domain-containing protein [Sphingomonas sp. RT2P30]|uniref:MOSC domain-containing protein n=1 Tax=Parasphingomonas halimpatiens TaxID=3096162 RepID=UPI002FC8B7FF
MIARVASLQVGQIAPLGPDAVPSGFVKQAVAGPVEVGTLGLDGDAQADLTVHGGPEKAVYGYAASHYPLWANDFPNLADRFVAGSMGENLTIAGIDESDLCVGDVHAIGTALLQLCQPRRPCFKLALALGEARLGKAMVRSGRSGWYYRVLREGAITAGDAVTLVERPNPAFAFSRLVTIVNLGGADVVEMRAMAEMPGVASRIAARARAALDS